MNSGFTRPLGIVLWCLGFAGCGGGDGGSEDPAPAVTYSVGGQVAGLAGSGLVLRNNGVADLAVNVNGNFTFGTQQPTGAAYDVRVIAQPENPSQTCTISHASGSIFNSNVTNVAVACATNLYRVGGSVTGLAGSGLTLVINGGDPLTVGANGTFSFPTSLASGASYAVTIATQPDNPSQTCTLAHASGTLVSSDVSNLAVSCSTNAYRVGGTVSGVAGPGLTLRINGSNALAIESDGNFIFPSAFPSGTAWSVAIATQPERPSPPCLLTRNAGTVGNQDVTTVRVICSESMGTVGGTITGLRGTNLELRNRGGDALIVNANGGFVFDTAMSVGDQYSVTVATEPRMPRQTCTVKGATGTVSNGAVTTVAIDCTLRAGNLRATVPAPTYPAGSGELLTFRSLNSARGSRFGQLAQDESLDAAARAHAQYLAAHSYDDGRFDPRPLSANTASGTIGAHAEQQGESGFTGTVPAERARAAGYAWLDGAEAAVFNVGAASRDCSDQILDSLVLRPPLMSTEMRDIGVGIADTADGKGFVCVVLAAYADVRGEAPGGWLGVYPFDGEESITLAMASDATGESFGTNRGMPVMFMADPDAPLSLTVTVRNDSTNQVVDSALVTNATLPDELSSNEVFAVPSVYLEPNTTYSVHAVGTVEGLPVDQTTRFRTGARSHSAPFAVTNAPRSMRAVYAYPTDRAVNADYGPAAQMALEHLQGWYQQQLGGETFSIYGALPQVCALPHASAYYLDNTWDKVQADIQSCVPAAFGDPDYDWILYVDVDHGCGLPGRLGAGWDSLTMLPRSDFEGLLGRDTGRNDCGDYNPVEPVSRWIGGLGHELGHTFNIPHSPGCEAGTSGAACDPSSLMWAGYVTYPATHFLPDQREILLSHRFINLQRFGR